MEMNFPVLLGAALIPMIVGFIWYNPKVFGTAWMKAAGMTDEKMKSGNMPLIFGISFLLSILLAVIATRFTIHQNHVPSLFLGMTDQASIDYLKNFQETYGQVHRTFTHGMVHGFLVSVFLVLPIFGTNALFERKSFKYVAVNWGYWLVTLMLMGGVVCQWH
jgi:UDP-N-acetylmuramyl pentapeptide phosphotransferase/UDP-N-acetylglucosamine-1-phosphate transferase